MYIDSMQADSVREDNFQAVPDNNEVVSSGNIPGGDFQTSSTTGKPPSNIEAPEGYELKLKEPKVTPKEIEGYWESFFTQKRGERCSGSKILRYELSKIGINEKGKVIGDRIKKGPFGWVKQWGFGQVAYLFDFFDPSLRPLHIEEFKKVWDAFKAYPSIDSEYNDPYIRKTEIPNELDAVSKQRLSEQIAKFDASIDNDVYNLSVNAVQVNKGLVANKWYLDRSVADNSKAFIKQFDMNFDGRLSPRELILGSIYHNKGLLGSDDCILCYEDLTDKIDGIFSYIDCNNDGTVSAKEMYEHLPKLRRETQKWNFFSLADKATIRTAVVNDFILKNQFSINGRVNKNEFRLGVLLGFWDRQTGDHGIIEDDSFNMKKLRWKDDDVVDIGAMDYIEMRAEAKAEAERREREKEMAKPARIEITLAKGSERPEGWR